MNEGKEYGEWTEGPFPQHIVCNHYQRARRKRHRTRKAIWLLAAKQRRRNRHGKEG